MWTIGRGYCDDFIIAPYRLLGWVASARLRDTSVAMHDNMVPSVDMLVIADLFQICFILVSIL